MGIFFFNQDVFGSPIPVKAHGRNGAFPGKGEHMAAQKISERLDSLLREELWGRIEPKDIGISKFKILDDLFNMIVSENAVSETLELTSRHMEKHGESITSMYLRGLIGYHRSQIEESIQLKKLIDIFIDNHKWAVVELLAEKILEYGESSAALRALALSLERLGRSKDAIPVLENLLKLDRFDADVAKKLAMALSDDENDKSIHYLRISIEGLIKNRKFEEVPPLWNRLVQKTRDDMAFFERIERLLIESKQYDLVASLLKSLLLKYRDDQNPEQSIELLKKILKYRPDDSQARKELIGFYKQKYGEHSQYEQFLRLSKLGNFKTPVKYAIQDFEKNIVFDVGNYAFHESWKLGKISDINNERITINFKDKEEHSMSIQMALQSLKPIQKDHLYVMQYEDPETLRNIFENDFIQFFEILIKSYGGSINLADIKRELIPAYLAEKQWAKWWTRARTMIKKDPHYGVSDSKKDLIYLREKPVTYVEELLDAFTTTESFSERLSSAMEFVNNIEMDEGAEMAAYFIDYFNEEIKGKSATRQILSYFILKGMSKFVDPGRLKLDAHREKIISFMKDNQDLSLISMKITSYDYKKELVNLIEESREDWPQIFSELLFETPVRIHRYLINELIRAHSYNIINAFIDSVITGARKYPEIFLWVSRNLYGKTWDYDWLDYSVEGLTLTYFRLMSDLKKIEPEGSRLKTTAMEILFNNKASNLKYVTEQCGLPLLARVFEIFSNLSYVEESHRETFLDYIKAAYPDFQKSGIQAQDESAGEEKLIVTREGYDRMKAELDRLAKVEMVNLSRELSKVADVSADLRENVEYTALIEKQGILELEISRIDGELKMAEILDPSGVSTDSVDIGTRVVLTGQGGTGEKIYTILGPWEADFEKGILSYRSPLARSILGKKRGDVVELKIDDEKKVFVVSEIQVGG